jgi:repressor LexA
VTARVPLSSIEQQVYHYLLDFLAEHTFQPSVRDIGAALRIPSTKSVTDLLASLERKGYVKRHPGRSRGVTLVGYTGGTGTMPVPVMRPVAGAAELSADGHLTLDRSLVPAAEAFLVRAFPGDAPRFGIHENDLVMVHPSQRARDGDAVAVRVGGAVLVRTMQRRGATLLLEAPDVGEDLELGPGDDYVVLGVMAGVVRVITPLAQG